MDWLGTHQGLLTITICQRCRDSKRDELALPRNASFWTRSTARKATVGKEKEETCSEEVGLRDDGFDPGDDDRAPRMVNFSTATGLSTKLTVYEFDLDGNCLDQYSQNIPGLGFFHDFVHLP